MTDKIPDEIMREARRIVSAIAIQKPNAYEAKAEIVAFALLARDIAARKKFEESEKTRADAAAHFMEKQAMADESLMPADVAGLVKRLLLTPDCDVRQMSDNCVEAATALKSQAAELAVFKEMYAREGAKALYELERAEAAEAQLAEARKALADIRSEAIRCRGEQSYRNFASFAARRALEGGKVDG